MTSTTDRKLLLRRAPSLRCACCDAGPRHLLLTSSSMHVRARACDSSMRHSTGSRRRLLLPTHHQQSRHHRCPRHPSRTRSPFPGSSVFRPTSSSTSACNGSERSTRVPSRVPSPRAKSSIWYTAKWMRTTCLKHCALAESLGHRVSASKAAPPLCLPQSVCGQGGLRLRVAEANQRWGPQPAR